MENVSGSRIEISASSVIGTRRKQQDSYVYFRTDKGSLACVCDGMGGLSGGERSSALCTRMLAEDFLREAPLCAPSDFFGWESDKLDEAVSSLRTEAGEPLGSGTTIVAVYLEEKDDRYNMSWLSVGDSRIYVLRNGHIDCIVREHNYRAVLNSLLRKGSITPEKYRIEQFKGEALTSYLGMGGLTLRDISHEPLPLIEGDFILLCSDGLYRAMSDDMIAAVIEDNSFDTERAANELVRTASELSDRGQDNTTAVLVSYR